MYFCHRCGHTTPDRCRAAHAAEQAQADERTIRMNEIRRTLESMTDEEFKAFNRRMMEA